MSLLGAVMIVAAALCGLCGATAWGATTGSVEGENAVVSATCSSVSVAYQSFPNLPDNVVAQTLTIHGVKISKSTVTFNGPTGTDTIPIVVPPGAGVGQFSLSTQSQKRSTIGGVCTPARGPSVHIGKPTQTAHTSPQRLYAKRTAPIFLGNERPGETNDRQHS